MKFLGILAAVVVASLAGVRAGACQTSSQELVVVLQNDAVVVGRVAQTAGGISVRTSSGSTAVVRFQQVAFLAESLEAAYSQLASSADLAQAQELQRLFDWTLRYGLFERSVEIMARARSQNLDPGKLAMMQRRLDAKLLDSVPVLTEAASRPSRPQIAPRQPTQKQIELAIDSLPQGAEAYFNQQLHAKLIAGCAAAKCHSRDHATLSLWHDGIGVAAPRGYTRHNLCEILQWVDRADPASSPLLRMAQTAHGGQAEAAFDPSDNAFQLIQYWTYAVSQYPDKYLSEVLNQLAQGTPALKSVAALPQPVEVAQVGFVEDQPLPVAPEQPDARPTTRNYPKIVDACDPNLFNRLHHPDRAK